MGSFRELSAHDVIKVLGDFGVGGYQSHSPIAAGTVNTNVRVATDTGALFLRINEGKAEQDVVREAAIVEHVSSRGVPTPLPLAVADGRRYTKIGDAFASVFPWVLGHTLSRDALVPGHAAAAGRALAQLHSAGADYADHSPGRYEPAEISRRFKLVSKVADPALLEAQRILGPQLQKLSETRATDLPMGLIHGDLFIDNVLFAADGQLTALLDFEQASWGRLAYDIAVTVLAFGFGHDDFRVDVTRALLDAYCEVRRPTSQERDAFGAELEFAACRFAVTRITDVYTRRDLGAPGGKDFNRYLARLRCVSRDWRPTGSVVSLE